MGIRIGKPNGMMELWSVGILGMKSGKRIYSTKNVESNFYDDDSRKTSIFCLYPKKYANVARVSMQLSGLDSFFLETHLTVAPEPLIPIFQHSNIPFVSAAN